MNHLGRAIKAAITACRMNQSQASELLGFSTGYVSKLIAGKAGKPDDDILCTLCTRWPDKETGLHIMQAHLKDEILRGGRSLDELDIILRGTVSDPIDEHLSAIQRMLKRDPDLRNLIRRIGTLAMEDESEAVAGPDSPSPDAPAADDDNIIQFATVPCYPVAAGKPITGDEDTAEIPAHLAADHFAVRVFGDSMEPEVKDGSIVIIMDREKLKRPMLKKGFIYTFIVDGQATIKRYNTRKATKREIDAGKSYVSEIDGQTKVKVLESLNPAYPEIVLCPEDDPQMTGWYNPEVQL